MNPRSPTLCISWKSVPGNCTVAVVTASSPRMPPTTWASPCCSGDSRGAWGWGLLAWAVLIGFSRIHLGVHYPGDVLGGFIVGWVGRDGLTPARRWTLRNR